MSKCHDKAETLHRKNFATDNWADEMPALWQTQRSGPSEEAGRWL